MGMRVLKQMHEQTPDSVAVVMHTVSLSTIAGVFLQALPVLAVLLPVIYYAILIWESKTFAHWRNNMRMRRLARRAAKLRAKAKLAEAKIEADETVRRAATVAAEKVASAAVEAKTLVVEAEAKVAENKLDQATVEVAQEAKPDAKVAGPKSRAKKK